MIVAIDGPSGAGKSTVATEVAKQLHLQLIDTGAIYRTLTFLAISNHIDLNSPSQLASFAKTLDFEFQWENGINQIYCNHTPIGDEIRTELISTASSKVASFPEVRDVLLSIQRNLGKKRPSLLEGRDIGSVVFPHADVKIYLKASSHVRALRRLEQMHEKGMNANFDEVKLHIEERDQRDSSRKVAPLVCPDDATVIDSTSLDIEQVIDKVLHIVKQHTASNDI